MTTTGENMETETEQKERAIAVFDDPRNINFGQARIIWGRASQGITAYYPEGWVLPGGQRTTDREVAFYAAMQIDLMAKGARA